MKKTFYFTTLVTFIAICALYIIFIAEKVDYDIDTKYLDKLFDKTRVVDIVIEIDDENAEKLYSDVSKEKYVHASITIDGEKYEDVGIRTKGNYIYTVAEPKNNPTYKWAYKVKFNKYNKEQTFHGLTEIALNTNFSDPTYMKEILNYGFFEKIGLDMPYYTFGNVTLNEENFGLVTFVEFYDIPWMARYQNDLTGNIYKPNNEFDETKGFNAEPKYTNAELKFIDYSFDNYSAIFEKTVTDDITDNEDKNRLIQILEELSKNNTKHFDIDSYIKYLAVANSISLFDTYSYSGKNFYLYENNNYLKFMPYDLNLAYATYIVGEGQSETFDVSLNQFNQDPKTCNKPLTCIVRYNENYYREYNDTLKTFVNKYFKREEIDNLIAQYESLIKDYTTNDNYDFSVEEHQESLKHLKLYFSERLKYINSYYKNTAYNKNENYSEKKLTNFKSELYERRNNEIKG